MPRQRRGRGESISPELHPIVQSSSPEPHTGVHQQCCDLEGVEGQHPTLTQPTTQTMMTFQLKNPCIAAEETKIKAQEVQHELDDSVLELIHGGRAFSKPALLKDMYL